MLQRRNQDALYLIKKFRLRYVPFLNGVKKEILQRIIFQKIILVLLFDWKRIYTLLDSWEGKVLLLRNLPPPPSKIKWLVPCKMKLLQRIAFAMLITWACRYPRGVWKYSALNYSNSCSYRFCGKNVAGRFRSPKSKEEETNLLSEVTLKATQYKTRWGKKVFKELWICLAIELKKVHIPRLWWRGCSYV